jgi:hypothetical protein
MAMKKLGILKEKINIILGRIRLLTSTAKLRIPVHLSSNYRVLISLGITAIVLTSLLLSNSPVKAFSVGFPDLPASGTIGTIYSFGVNLNLADGESLTIQQINFYIFKEDDRDIYRATFSDIPLADGIKEYPDTGAGNAAFITKLTTNGSGYGYGYATGYGTGYGTGYTSINFNVRWQIPSLWPAGDYLIDTEVITGGGTFIQTSSPVNLIVADATISITEPSAIVLDLIKRGTTGSSSIPGTVTITASKDGYPIAYSILAIDTNTGTDKGFMMNGSTPLSTTNKFMISPDGTTYSPADTGFSYNGSAKDAKPINLPFYAKQTTDGSEALGTYGITISLTASLP